MQKPVVNVMVKAARAAGGVLLRNMNRLDALKVIEKDRQDYASEVDEQAEQIIGREAVLAIIDPDGDLDYAAGWVSGDRWLSRRAALDKAVIDAS